MSQSVSSCCLPGQAPAAEPCTAQPTPRFPPVRSSGRRPTRTKALESSGRGGPRCARRYFEVRAPSSGGIGKRGGTPHLPIICSQVPRINPLALDRRFSAEIRVLTGFHAYLQNLFICKTRTGRPLVFAIRFWNLRLLKSHWARMGAKSGLIQVGVGCERAKPQR